MARRGFTVSSRTLLEVSVTINQCLGMDLLSKLHFYQLHSIKGDGGGGGLQPWK